jgi:hypothetical protein
MLLAANIVAFMLQHRGLFILPLLYQVLEHLTELGRLPFLRLRFYGKSIEIRLSIIVLLLLAVNISHVSSYYLGSIGSMMMLPILTRPIVLPSIRRMFYRPIGTY